MRLVLCDDQRILCDALATALEDHGHQILAVTTTATAGVTAVTTINGRALCLAGPVTLVNTVIDVPAP